MSKLSFRARALDPTKPMPIYLAEELPDLPEYSAINRAVPQMPSGMEKEEESVSFFSVAAIFSSFFLCVVFVCVYVRGGSMCALCFYVVARQQKTENEACSGHLGRLFYVHLFDMLSSSPLPMAPIMEIKKKIDI